MNICIISVWFISNKAAVLTVRVYIICIHLYHAQVPQMQKSIHMYPF